MTATLSDADGGVASYRVDDSGGVRWVLDLRPYDGVDPARVAAAARASLGGHRVCLADDRLVDSLLAVGGRIQRRGSDYVFDTTAGVPAVWREPHLPTGLGLAPFAVTDSLVAAFAAAVPPDHPDHDPTEDIADNLTGFIEGRWLGPLLVPAARVVTDGHTDYGGIVVTVRDRPPEIAGPWVCELFVHPERRGTGLGRALLQHAIAAAADVGYPRVGLVVTAGNPAERLYQSVGFQLARTLTNVELPV
ncbi:MAG: GNAT family N-acetyltransferase [Mycobacteriales bacterium]|nr:GNAT family N-acetyltransferase [Frankia sp.]